jgi:hypothetical protein
MVNAGRERPPRPEPERPIRGKPVPDLQSGRRNRASPSWDYTTESEQQEPEETQEQLMARRMQEGAASAQGEDAAAAGKAMLAGVSFVQGPLATKKIQQELADAIAGSVEDERARQEKVSGEAALERSVASLFDMGPEEVDLTAGEATGGVGRGDGGEGEEAATTIAALRRREGEASHQRSADLGGSGAEEEESGEQRAARVAEEDEAVRERVSLEMGDKPPGRTLDEHHRL